ncbi:MAG: sigma-70 family RNA polymerase sigma factor [Planctomycetia bacterium]|nr:sigma-70 family RNA polymerase sigma factor [Planctomycetia bacterium]
MSQPDSTATADRRKATELFLKHHDFVRLVAFETAPDMEYQDDIANDCFIEFVEKAQKWDYQSDIRPLLRKMTQNIAMRYWRTHLRTLPENMRKIAQHLQDKLYASDEFEDLSRLQQEQILLDFCMKKLTPENQKLVTLYYCDKVPYAQLAEIFHQSVNAIQKRMARIRVTLRKCIEQAFGKTAGGLFDER